MNDIAIRVEGLGKQFRIGAQEQYKTLRDTLTETLVAPFRFLRNGASSKSPAETFWALKDVSFEVKHGEVIGIIGRNGAGKSTLLKILSRITEPTEGHAEIHGRVGSLLEVGTGFHPELTGRENILLNGAILGMKRVEILSKFDEIVSFAEIDKFIDTPVKHYSSGMYVRLAFAVAAHLDSEILIVDEVLAVGDAAFQNKCLGKIGDVARHGRTILFVSHNISTIQQLTLQSLLLHSGMLTAAGPTSSVVAQYLDSATDRHRTRYESETFSRYRGDYLSREVEFITFEFPELSTKFISADDHLSFRIELRGRVTVTQFRISTTIFRLDGTPVGGAFGPATCSIGAGDTAWFTFTIRDHRLAPGAYYCDFGVGLGIPETGHRDFDVVQGVLHFEVMPRVSKDGTLAQWANGWGSIIFSEVFVDRLPASEPCSLMHT